MIYDICPRSSVWIEQRFPKPLVARSSRAGGILVLFQIKIFLDKL